MFLKFVPKYLILLVYKWISSVTLWLLINFLLIVFLLLCIAHWGGLSYISLLFFGTLHSNGYTFPFLLCFSLLFFPQLFRINLIGTCSGKCQGKFLVFMLVAQLWTTLCDPMEYSPPGSSVHGILQARILEWVAISFSKGSSQPRDWTWVSHFAGTFFTSEPSGKFLVSYHTNP